jgi:Delta14-sterol reductase
MAASLTPQNLALAAAIWVAFVGGIFLLRIVLPGKLHTGQKLKDGSRRTYKLNGLRILLVLAALLAAAHVAHVFSLATVNRLFWPLFVVANVFALLHTAHLYLTGVRKLGGAPRHGSLLKDLWMGVELNPELLGVDLKMFAYLPSLMGLWVLNVSFGVAQHEALGHLTTRMWLYQGFFTIYIVNYFEFEYGMLHTWDVIAEDFGYMLVWGDYVLVPFFYSICGWWLLGYLEPIPTYEAVALCVLFAVGFAIFRGANQQKHDYKEHPERPIWGKAPETVGGRLLVSGFWGIGRKLNYTGELMAYFAWTLTTGFQSVVPYLLPLWLLCLFSHRAWRDDLKCRAKYGPLWTEYCARARFRMFPIVY